nr:MAG TPA: hypothetical protein [Caudoviricetes sp.]
MVVGTIIKILLLKKIYRVLYIVMALMVMVGN